MVPRRYHSGRRAYKQTSMKRALAGFVVLLAVACGSSPPAPVGAPLTITQLKFAVIDSVGLPAYCDRDFYPIAREGGEQANAIATYPQIQADSELYSAILAHEKLYLQTYWSSLQYAAITTVWCLAQH